MVKRMLGLIRSRSSKLAEWCRPAIASLMCLPALCLLTCSCTGGRTRAYTGLEQPPERIALLKHQTGFNNPSVYFLRIDGKAISGRKYQYGEIELLPGRHEVEFGFEAAGLSMTYSHSIENARVVFDAEVNHEYEARAEKLPATGILATVAGDIRWRGIIVDLGSGSVVATSSRNPTETVPSAERALKQGDR